MVIVKKKLGSIKQSALARFAAKAAKASGLHGDVNVLVTSSDELRELNRRFRKKNKATDVLSFPLSMEGFGGDIAISADIARENGRLLGHSLEMELKILILHGVLHLAGFDHENDNGDMAQKEMRLRERLGLNASLIERSGSTRPLRKRVSNTGAARTNPVSQTGRRK
jgi:probable rRNA maturation factor